MDLSKFLTSVGSVTSISDKDRPKIPARAATAASIARALASIAPIHRQSLSSSSEELSSIYGNTSRAQIVDELEEEFYEEMFDPLRHILENIPSEENEITYFEGKAAVRLLQLDKVTETLSYQVMEHHEVMVKGMHLVSELEKDMKVANVICMNGRRRLTSSRNEVSRDLVVNTRSRRKQALLDILPVLTELRHAQEMQATLETHVNEGKFFKAFQVLPEYLQLLDGYSELLVIHEMSSGVEIWLEKTLQKLDSILLGVCRDFKETSFLTVVDAYALIGDIYGLTEKIQSFFMQEVISETHAVLKEIVLEDLEAVEIQYTRLTYSDLCTRIPECKFRKCLLATLAVIFNLMCSYHAIMNFNVDHKVSLGYMSPAMHEEYVGIVSSKNVQHGDSSLPNCSDPNANDGSFSEPVGQGPNSALAEEPSTSATTDFIAHDSSDSGLMGDGTGASSSGSSWFHLRSDATALVSQTLQRGRRNLWQLATTRLFVLLSSEAVGSMSIHQFLKDYEELNTFILAGEAFCGAEAIEFRRRMKSVCESYYGSFHRQNIHALKLVLEKENWFTIPPETIQVVSFSGLVGDGAALINQSARSSTSKESQKSLDLVKTSSKQSGFSHWISSGNPFCPKAASKEFDDSLHATSAFSEVTYVNFNEASHKETSSADNSSNHSNHVDPEDENEDLHADFIDEDSQLPSRLSYTNRSRNHSSSWNMEDMEAHTGSSICVLRLMDKYARLMQRLDIIDIEFFKGICQLFGIYFHFVFESFGQQNTNPSGKGLNDALGYRLKTALIRIQQDCGQWVKSPPSFPSSSCAPLNIPLSHTGIGPNGIPTSNLSHVNGTSFGLKERCAGADTISLVAQLLQKSKAHLHSILLQNNAATFEDFYTHLVDTVPDLVEQIHRTTARLLLHISGYADQIANAKWEVKELGMEHNRFVDLLLGEFKRYNTRLTHGGIQTEVQCILIGYGLENLSETVVEGLSRVKRCTDQGRALMSLDFQVLITGLQHSLTINVKPKLQRVETFIKAFYLPETEYVHWARAHPEYTKNQIAGLINLVATMKGWKRKTKLEVLEKIESASAL